MRVELRPIHDSDAVEVGRFLHSNMDARASAEDWARLIEVPWEFERPNAGFMLLAGEAVVGAHLAFYSERRLDGRSERFCDLGTWCVRPEHRIHSLRLLEALLDQDGYHFTDLTPDQTVLAIDARLGFEPLQGSTALVPNLPWPSLPGRVTISSDPAVVERELSGPDLQIFRDHAAGATRHAVLSRGEERCHVVFRRDRRMGIPRALIMHVSNPDLYRGLARPFARHLLLRHGALVQQIEHAILDRPPRPHLRVRSPHRMLRRADDSPARIDYLYSELARQPW